jgi:hypothetical protein
MLNGDPPAEAELPGVEVPAEPHVLFGAPLCPVVGFTAGFVVLPAAANAVSVVLLAANAVPVVKSDVPTARDAMMRFISDLLFETRLYDMPASADASKRGHSDQLSSLKLVRS